MFSLLLLLLTRGQTVSRGPRAIGGEHAAEVLEAAVDGRARAEAAASKVADRAVRDRRAQREVARFERAEGPGQIDPTISIRLDPGGRPPCHAAGPSFAASGPPSVLPSPPGASKVSRWPPLALRSRGCASRCGRPGCAGRCRRRRPSCRAGRRTRAGGGSGREADPAADHRDRRAAASRGAEFATPRRRPLPAGVTRSGSEIGDDRPRPRRPLPMNRDCRNERRPLVGAPWDLRGSSVENRGWTSSVGPRFAALCPQQATNWSSDQKTRTTAPSPKRPDRNRGLRIRGKMIALGDQGVTPPCSPEMSAGAWYCSVGAKTPAGRIRQASRRSPPMSFPLAGMFQRSIKANALGAKPTVKSAFRIMPTLANAPARSETWNARAVPMACDVRPSANPIARSS